MRTWRGSACADPGCSRRLPCTLQWHGPPGPLTLRLGAQSYDGAPLPPRPHGPQFIAPQFKFEASVPSTHCHPRATAVPVRVAPMYVLLVVARAYAKLRRPPDGLATLVICSSHQEQWNTQTVLATVTCLSGRTLTSHQDYHSGCPSQLVSDKLEQDHGPSQLSNLVQDGETQLEQVKFLQQGLRILKPT